MSVSSRWTDEEKRALRALRNLAKRWPATLGIFVGDGTLNVYKGPSIPNYHGPTSGPDRFAADSAQMEEVLGIRADGGGW